MDKIAKQTPDIANIAEIFSSLLVAKTAEPVSCLLSILKKKSAIHSAISSNMKEKNVHGAIIIIFSRLFVSEKVLNIHLLKVARQSADLSWQHLTKHVNFMCIYIFFTNKKYLLCDISPTVYSSVGFIRVTCFF